MIKFFRKIRYKLLNANKLSKPSSPAGRYLFYAIGEIVLVVIGILIALQINNWNEGRKQDNQENLYLERLLLENQQDLLTFTQGIEELQKGNQTIRDMSAAFNDTNSGDTLLWQTVTDYLMYGCHYPFFNPSTSTFEDLSSTGNLVVIKDTELRDLIVNHYANYQFVESNFQVNTNWALPVDAPFYIENDALKYEPFTASLFGDLTIEEISQDLRNNKQKYLRNAAVHYWINEDCINHLNDVKQKTITLIQRLETELHNR